MAIPRCRCVVAVVVRPAAPSRYFEHEVLSKYPVAQHFVFGSLLAADWDAELPARTRTRTRTRTHWPGSIGPSALLRIRNGVLHSPS